MAKPDHTASGERTRHTGIPGGVPFAYFWSARSLSLIGDYAFRVAFIAHIITVTQGSAWGLALANAVLLLPALVFYLLGGAIGDRVKSRRKVMIVSDALRAVICIGAAAAVALDAPVAVIVLLAMALSIGDGFFGPAAFAFMAEIVPSERLLGANSALSISQQVGLVVGPMVGGVLVSYQGAGFGFGFNALSFLVSAVFILLIRDVPSGRLTAKEAGVNIHPVRAVLAETRAGLTYVRTQQWLLISFAVGALSNAVFAGNLDVSVPLMVASGGTDNGVNLGGFYALQGCGAVLGAVILTRSKPTLLGPLMFRMLGLMAAALAAVGVFGDSAGTYIAALIYGVGLHYFNSLFGVVLQKGVPSALMSRVSSVAYLGFSGLMPLGTLLMGPMIVAFGTSTTLMITGIAICVLCLGAARKGAIRDMGTEAAS